MVINGLCINSVYSDPYNNGQPYSGPVALPWWNDLNHLPPVLEPYGGPSFQKAVSAPKQVHQSDSASVSYHLSQPAINLQPVVYRSSVAGNDSSCGRQLDLLGLDSCILKTERNRRGLEEQIKYLSRTDLNQRVASKWANVSNAALLQTAKELLSWDYQITPHAFGERFSLREVGSHRNRANADYTGYFTPVVEVRRQPDAAYRYPIYTAPKSGTRYSRQQIDGGALKGRNLEIGWTNDLVNLYFAHIQGSAIARYPDGTERYLGYADSNGHSYGSISDYLRSTGYIKGSLSNANVRRWLHENPHRIYEVLHRNPRYIFFNLTDRPPQTTTGSVVIPGHTVAVDDNFIPLGSVLLAEVPRVDHRGKQVGSDWKLLFAQDRGDAIKGPGRIDLYTGKGDVAEWSTYSMTGLHRTYLLVRKPGFLGDSLAARGRI